MTDLFDRVADLFDHQLAAGCHHGAQLAVYHDGELLLDRAGGVAGPDANAPETTTARRHLLFSCTKPLTATCVHLLADEGRLEYDDAVQEHWPEFAWPEQPKADVTVAHVLSHQAGLPRMPMDADPDAWLDWDTVIERLEDQETAYPPGEHATYHALSFGFLAGELVRRVAGQPVDEFARERVFEPLGMTNTYIGLPPDEPDDVADVVGFEPFDRCRDPGIGLGSHAADAAGMFNREDVRRAVVPAATGISTAHDLARLFACLANGGTLGGTQLLSPETVERATTVRATVEHDEVLGVPRRYAMGFERAGVPADKYGSCAPERVFGHGGLGSCVAWGDPDERVGAAYLTNGIRDEYEHATRASAIADAVRAAIRATGNKG